jgi:hypothetical protein
VLLLIMLAAGFLYENISKAHDRRFHPIEGQLQDVGGREIAERLVHRGIS